MLGVENQRIGWILVPALAALARFVPHVPAPPASQPALQASQLASAPAPREIIDVARFRDEIARFAEWDRKNSFPRDAALFVGSSSIRMWPTRESFPRWPVINRGFGGSTIAAVNHYFKHVVEPYQVRVIVFYAGDNDIAMGHTPEQVRDDFAAFMKLVRAGTAATATTRPSGAATPVVFLSIKPSGSRWTLWPDMQKANALIRVMAESTPGLFYVDVATPLLDAAGKPRAELYLDDRLHLSPAGYAEWKNVLVPVLGQLLGEK